MIYESGRSRSEASKGYLHRNANMPSYNANIRYSSIKRGSIVSIGAGCKAASMASTASWAKPGKLNCLYSIR